jgi:hypothetical protein
MPSRYYVDSFSFSSFFFFIEVIVHTVCSHVIMCRGWGGCATMMQRTGGMAAARRGCWLPHGRPWGPPLQYRRCILMKHVRFTIEICTISLLQHRRCTTETCPDCGWNMYNIIVVIFVNTNTCNMLSKHLELLKHRLLKQHLFAIQHLQHAFESTCNMRSKHLEHSKHRLQHRFSEKHFLLLGWMEAYWHVELDGGAWSSLVRWRGSWGV